VVRPELTPITSATAIERLTLRARDAGGPPPPPLARASRWRRRMHSATGGLLALGLAGAIGAGIARPAPMPLLRPATLQVLARPTDAEVRIDGQLAGGERPVLPGPHQVQVLRAGYVAWTEWIEIGPEERHAVRVALAPATQIIVHTVSDDER
jgi:hypothetical protein